MLYPKTHNEISIMKNGSRKSSKINVGFYILFSILAWEWCERFLSVDWEIDVKKWVRHR